MGRGWPLLYRKIDWMTLSTSGWQARLRAGLANSRTSLLADVLAGITGAVAGVPASDAAQKVARSGGGGTLH